MKKKVTIIVLAVIGLALLAAAAFMVPHLFSSQNAQAGGPAAVAGSDGGKGGPGDRFANVTVVPSDELPKTDYNLAGMVTRVKDNSIFISPAFLDENEVEVVVSADTKIYLYQGQDTVDQAADGSWSEVQDKLEPITVKDVVENDILSVWADKRGDRYIAQYIRVLH